MTPPFHRAPDRARLAAPALPPPAAHAHKRRLASPCRPGAPLSHPLARQRAPRARRTHARWRTRSLVYAMLAWYSCSERTPLAPFFLTSAMPSAVALAAAIVVM